MWGIVGKTDGSPMGFEDLYNQFQAQTMFRLPTAVLRAGNIIPLIQDFQKFRSDPRPVILNRTQTAAIFSPTIESGVRLAAKTASWFRS